MTTISIYSNIKQVKGDNEIPVDLLLENIRDGKYQDDVLAVRNGQKDKTNLVAVCMSGRFSERRITGLIKHSGFLCIDIDDVDPEEVKSLLCVDRYVYAAFVSAGGKGLAVMFKINPDKHADAFEGLQEYLYTNYHIVVDPSCRDVSRARFVSWDPHLYLNEQSDRFVQYPKKQPASLRKVQEVVFVQNDFESIVQEIESRRIDLTGDYQAWLRIGFALADKFGQNGRQYYHRISQFHHKYKYELADRQYTNCLKAGRSGVTIATFYYYAKQAGLQTVSARTQKIATVARNIKKSGSTKAEAAKMLKDADGIDAEESGPIIDQVWAGAAVENDDSLITQVEEWLRYNYSLRRNVITRFIEVNGVPIEDRDMNTIWKETAKVYDKVSKDMVRNIIHSNFTEDYNPFDEFFERYQHIRPTGVIDEYFSCIQSDTGMEEGSEFFPDFVQYYAKRWLVGMIATLYGKPSPLMMVLSGEINTGKTEFFQRMLPAELQQYFAECKMERDKDDDVLMCKKILIFDDELSGKNKKEEAKLKSILSKQNITVREPYAHASVTMKRICTFCGTTNHKEILRDPTGNRRIIPVNVLSIDFTRIDEVDRIELIMEAYWLFKEGFKWELNKEDIERLNAHTTGFENYSSEYELLLTHFEYVPDNVYNPSGIWMTYADIITYLERYSTVRVNREQLMKEANRLGWKSKLKTVNGSTARRVCLVETKPRPVF
ncbi:VapE domain-containing protein [Chitinophaga sp. sic0106]|uniref:VapE domain-containing protein n=1 Tax=Chitinophaga sp. sic0106 TaxID=2854785 RepID=UPI001C480A62|nr:VapE domain-containing protein [Chitinophaga sp. sic0106]MBV7534072.1 PriCT-2 domain-containing protein [Chitinophaga sp. sic0106]